MKIAFLVQAHSSVRQLSMLSKALTSTDSDVYIHFDKKSREDLGDLKDAVTVARVPVYHGGFSQVKATLNLLGAAVKKNYDYFFLLSGQCFPIKSLTWLQQRLDGKTDFINCYPMPRDAFKKTLDRLEHFYFERHAESAVHSLLNKISYRLPKRNFVRGLSLWPYAGSQWWCLRKNTVLYILDYVARNPGFSRYMSTTTCSDEVFFQSIISNMGNTKEQKPALFCADFDAETARPKIYTTKDIPMLDGRDVFVARKMDLNVDSGIIDYYSSLARQ